ncbi:bifunctional riboflavin kinase/FAD synthetase [bacterium]|nr:bifunctional riboflavin kinase/FAD synthetase [bacterium]
MKVLTSSADAKALLKKGCVLTMGNYDGIHLGHRHIIKGLLKEAKKRKLPALLYTFNPHPVSVLAPKVAPSLINTFDQKMEILEKLGLDYVVAEKFNKNFAKLSPQKFFDEILVKRLKPHFITVGYDFTFGARRAGNIENLEILSYKNKIDLKIIDPCMKGNTLSSSSLIRRFVSEGKMREASELLTRAFFIDGEVIPGFKRGRAMGIKTANVKTHNKLLPPPGVYVTRTSVGDQLYKSVTNIGFNPTFQNAESSIETHILDFKKEIYGHNIRIHFIEKIRDEKTFSDSNELFKQIEKDIAKAQKILAASKQVSLII